MRDWAKEAKLRHDLSKSYNEGPAFVGPTKNSKVRARRAKILKDIKDRHEAKA